MTRLVIYIPIVAAICAATIVSARYRKCAVAGKALVETNCAALPRDRGDRHQQSSRRTGVSNAVTAIPDRSLAEALAEGISTGHPDMPEFVASPQQIDAILAYVGSLQSK